MGFRWIRLRGVVVGCGLVWCRLEPGTGGFISAGLGAGLRPIWLGFSCFLMVGF